MLGQGAFGQVEEIIDFETMQIIAKKSFKNTE
jgi:hypothetical protein